MAKRLGWFYVEQVRGKGGLSSGAAFAAVLFLFSSFLYSQSAHADVGRTSGTFDVSPNGAATYSIPLFSIPGSGSLQPSIALVYNSNADVGYVGRGWSLSGNIFSSIKRCNRTVAQDGTALPPTLQFNDRYCIDGNRLRLQSGSYAAQGSVWATEVADFSRITAGPAGTFWTGPTSWTVERKDGLLYTYGGSSDSYAQPGIEWKLREISDRAGNKIRITWELGDWSATHPLKIEWTQTSAGSGSYVYSMDFHYSAGGNAPASAYWRYFAGQPSIDNDLLTHITVSVSGTVVRNYVLDYGLSPTTGAKRLIEVRECSDSAATNCLFPTTIAYQDGASGVYLVNPALNLTGNVTEANGDFDFDADGTRDIAYKVSGTWYVRMGSVSSGYGPEVNTGLTGDLRGGKLLGTPDDQLLAVSSGTWHVYAWNGSSFSATSTGITTAASSSSVVVADMDGDGRDDLFYIAGTGANFNGWDKLSPWVNFDWRRNTTMGGSLSFASPVSSQWVMEGSSQFPSPPPDSGYGAQITSVTLSKGGDRDGDGRQDLNLYVVGDWGFFPFEQDELFSPEGSFEEYLVVWDGSGPWLEVRVLTDEVSWYWSPNAVTLIPADFNGDGCQDTSCATYSTTLLLLHCPVALASATSSMDIPMAPS